RTHDLEKLLNEEERAEEMARMRVEELKRSEERLSFDVEDLTRQKGRIEEEMETLRAAASEMEGKVEEERTRLSECEGTTAGLLEELNDKDSRRRAAEATALEAMTAVSDIKHSIQALLKEEELLREREAKAWAELDEAEAELKTKEGPIEGLKAEMENAGGKREAAEAEFAGAAEKLAGLENALLLKTAERKALDEERAAKSARLEALEEMGSGLNGSKEGITAVMKSGREGGMHGLLADVMEASPGYERAVEAVLGERLQYVIVESQKEGVEAIEYLNVHASGRGSFVPLKDTRPPRYHAGSPSYDTPPSGTRALINEVSVKEEYRAVVNYLMGDVLLVDDMTSAMAIWQRNGISSTLVTPKGEMIDPQGIITGGHTNGSDGGVLQTKREIRELWEALPVLTQNLSALEEALKEMQLSTLSTRELLDTSKERLHTEELERVNLDGRLKVYEEEISRFALRRNALTSEIESAGEGLTNAAARKAGLSAERESIEAGLEKTEKEAAALAGEVRELGVKKESLAHTMTEIKVALASAEGRREHLSGQLAEKERLTEDTAGRLTSKKEEIETGRLETTARTEEASAHKAKVEELLERKDSIRKDEILKEEALTGLSVTRAELEREVKALTGELSGAQELKGRSELELKEIELGTNHLKERIIEKYGTEIDRYEPGEELKGEEFSSLEERAEELRKKVGAMGEVSLSALEEYGELEERHRFLVEQQEDLMKAVESLQAAITRINRTTREKFRKTFEEINGKFKETFPKLFCGGKAELRLTGDGDVLESGIEIVAQPPGKRLQGINLFSGGEKALTAIALIFSIFLIKPSPFCLLDEVDAPLDDVNIDRFNGFVREMSDKSQFVLITHNKRTMEMVDTLFGITMEEPGVSKTVSVVM
ncbi:MAG: chromosome segregation protein SMC, partial [Thermodesulfobacteriota bacterium]